MDEKKLRYRVLFAFGLLFLLSYGLMLLFGFGMSAPIDRLRMLGVLDPDWVLLAALLAALGILMLLSVFFKRWFYALTGLIAVFQITLVAQAYSSVYSFIDFFVFDNIVLGLLQTGVRYIELDAVMPILNMLLWLLPFIVYYLLVFMHTRKTKSTSN
jgi:hypothetical protein